MSEPTLVIGNKNYSSWSLRAWLFLSVHDIAFREVRLALETPEFEREIGRWSPTRRVPVLHADGLVVWDSLAICEYASERWLDGRGWPAERGARAMARSLAAEMHAGFGALRAALPMNIRAHYPDYPLSPAVRADLARIELAWRECRRRHGGSGPFLCGAFGIVDAMYAPVVLRLVSYGVTVETDTQGYMDAVLDLDALRRWSTAALAETERVDADEVTPP